MSLSPRTMNETRAQFTYGNLEAPPSDPTGPAVSITGIANFGTASGGPTTRVNRMYQIVNNLSHYIGAHSVRAGGDFLVVGAYPPGQAWDLRRDALTAAELSAMARVPFPGTDPVTGPTGGLLDFWLRARPE